MLTFVHRLQRAREDERGFTIIEVVIATSIMMVVLTMFFATLTSMTRSEDRSQRLVSNEQNVRFELDQLAREIRASNPLAPLPNAPTAATYSNQIEVVLGPSGGAQKVVRWTYDTVNEKMTRELMSSTASNATVLSTSFFLTRVRNVETGVPVFTYYGQQNEDLVVQALAANPSTPDPDPANCAVRVHITLASDSNPGPVPFTETQDVEVRNRLPGYVGCG